ncbi:hypothetical protein BW33_04338 [Pseudomonas sp. RIT288]|nr:hypothetical protein BW33_04338 [Pseudomonas sp. RIT288]
MLGILPAAGAAPAGGKDTEHLADKHGQDEQHHQKHEQQRVARDKIALRITVRLVHRRWLVQRIAAEHHQHRRHAVADALAEIAGLERRGDHLMNDHRGLRIGQPILQTVTDFDAQFALVTGNDQQRAVVLVLLADAPVPAQLHAVILDGGALQIRHRDHHQLLAGRLLVSLQLLAQLGAHRRLDHLRFVHHPPAQRRERQLGPGADGEQPEHQHQAYLQHTHE